MAGGQAGLVIDVSKGMFQADYFKRFKIKAFEYDEQTLDSRSEFIGELMDSMVAGGYDPQKPIKVSVNDENDAISGIILDGRHRSIAWQAMRNKKIIPSDDEIKKDPLKRQIYDRFLPKIELEPVDDMDMVIARQAYYDLHNQTKNAAVSKKRAEKNIKKLLREHKHIVTLDQAVQFLYGKGFTNRKVIERIWKAMQAEAEAASKKVKDAGKKKPFQNILAKFGIRHGDESSDNIPESERVKIEHATAETHEGQDTNYIHCICSRTHVYYTTQIEHEGELVNVIHDKPVLLEPVQKQAEQQVAQPPAMPMAAKQ